MVVQICSISVMELINVSLNFATCSFFYIWLYTYFWRERERKMIFIFNVCRPKMCRNWSNWSLLCRWVVLQTDNYVSLDPFFFQKFTLFVFFLILFCWHQSFLFTVFKNFIILHVKRKWFILRLFRNSLQICSMILKIWEKYSLYIRWNVSAKKAKEFFLVYRYLIYKLS